MMIKSVLIVDDSPVLLSVLKAQLFEQGIVDVETAVNGKQAFDLIKEFPYKFQLVITDLKMPVMDGMQLIESLSQTDYFNSVAIYSSLDKRVVSLAIDLARKNHVHLVGSLTKPFDREDLRLVLDRADYIGNRLRGDPRFIQHKRVVEAIEAGEIVPYFQPQIDCRTMRIVGFEVLCRIHVDNEMQLLLPADFITIVEKHGLIDFMTYKTLELALAEFNEIKREFPADTPLKLALNILPQQLLNEKLPEMLAAICELKQHAVEHTVIEITENQAIDTDRKISTLERLRIAGFGVSLDDFGTGFTNMGQIRQYPFTEIKMDRTMIQNIHKDRVSQVILNTMLELSRSYTLTIVAEGVENAAEFDYLCQQGELVAQGYLVSRPKPLEEIIRWVRAWQHQQSLKAAVPVQNLPG